MLYLVNAFSLNMLPDGPSGIVRWYRITPSDAANCLRGSACTNAIGHVETDNVVRTLLKEYACHLPPGQRLSVKLRPYPQDGLGAAGDALIVAQYIGPRLPEGATELPPGAKIEFFALDCMQ